MIPFFKRGGFLKGCLWLLILSAVSVAPCIFPCNVLASPGRAITVHDDRPLPKWKMQWDRAREEGRKGNHEIALKYYQELLQEKPNIEAARWEYCQLLFDLKRYDELHPYLQSLIGVAPFNVQYIAMTGFVALYSGDYQNAVKGLGQAYGIRPEGDFGLRVLQGYTDALVKLGRQEYALPLLEQLYLRKGGDSILAEQIAETALRLGRFEKARKYYGMLLKADHVPFSVLKGGAEAMIGSGDTDAGVKLWERIVTANPDAIDYLEKLAAYYQGTDSPEKALPYLMRIIEIKPDFAPELLLTSGRLYFYREARADKALSLYERYLQSMPEHHEIRQEILKVRERICKDLLAIVENDGAENLWEDLQLLTEDPLLIYNMMEIELESRMKFAAAIEVLKIIYENSDEKDDVAFRLSRLYAKTGKKRESYKALLLVKEKGSRNIGYHRYRLDFEMELGMSRAALMTGKDLLIRIPGDDELRQDLMSLASELGDISALRTIAEPYLTQDKVPRLFAQYLVLARGLVMTGSYLQAEQVCNSLLTAEWLSPDQSRDVMLLLADTKKAQGLSFEEQELSRIILNTYPDDREVLMRLFFSVLEEGDLNGAKNLLALLLKGNGTETAIAPEFIFDVAVARARLLEKDYNLSEAVKVLVEASLNIKEAASRNKVSRIMLNLDFELCRLYILQGKPRQCQDILERYRGREVRVLTVRFLQNIVNNRGRLDVDDLLKKTREAHNSSGAVTSLFRAATYAERMEQEGAAEEILREVLRREPHSTRAMVRVLEILVTRGKWDDAGKVVEDLSVLYPNDPYYARMELEISLKAGHYTNVVDATEFSEGGKDLPVLPRLLRARALWGAGMENDALDEYENILETSVNDKLQDALAALEGNRQDEQEEEPSRLFWGLFYYDLTNRLDNLNALDERDGFIALLGTDEGNVVADLYSDYRYEKLVRDEYRARKAVSEKRYLAAKKQYKRTLKQEESPQALMDLAKVYERLGDYSKEAEIYSVLSEQGAQSIELEESIQRNERIRSPTLGLEYLYEKRDGRDSAIDIIREEGGPTFKFAPGVSSEINLTYHELSYSPVAETETVEGRRMGADGWWEIIDGTRFVYDFGAHILDDKGGTTLLYDLRVEHKFEDNLKGHMVFGQNLVGDTLDSLRQGIDYRNVDIGFELDTESGFVVGAEYSRRSYSDDNDQNRLLCNLSYSMFSEFTTWTMKYNFELMQNTLEGVEQVDPVTGTTSYSMPYWSPENYSAHILNVNYHQLLKSFESFAASDSGYYNLGVKLGYESEENVVFGTNFDIFLEMSDHFLLKGDLSYDKRGDYDESRVLFSLMYRW